MNKYLKSILAITLICAIVSVLLAFTNWLTAPVIANQEASAVTDGLKIVLPNGEGFEEIDISGKELPETVTEVYTEKNGGYVVKLQTVGYDVGFVILCGIDKDCVVQGATCISSKETLGYEKTYGENFKGKILDDLTAIDTVAGATKTTSAYKAAVKDALNAVVVLTGGTADNRTDEEKLLDNLNAVLPEGAGEFEEVFMLDEIEGINTIYKATNNKGYVFTIGNEFIATDAEGKALPNTSNTAYIELVETTAQRVLDWQNQKIDISALENLPSQVKDAYKTDGGYTLIMHAAGYGINGGDKYHPASGIPIVIKVSATNKGIITSCTTISHAETANLGDACAKEEFYSQFNGKTEADYSEIDAISGATITTNGYKAAIGAVFEAVKILKGVS